jgi:DNA polymerase-4
MKEKSSPHLPLTTYHLPSKALPLIMHIDLNSCFATIEAQANRLLRGRPVGVAAYDTPRGFVLAANYAAKAKGVKLGVNVAEARVLAPGIVIMTPDPAKYRDAHNKFKELLLEYTDDVHPKSIDEFVLNLQGSQVLKKKKKLIVMIGTVIFSSQFSISNQSLKSNYQTDYSLLISSKMSPIKDEHRLHSQAMRIIGYEIKQKIYERLGEAVTVNVGIGPNRFLAKYAAGFNKPNGMTLIDHTNLLEFYQGMDLVDLPGINTRFRRRLFACGVTTPLQFLEADRWLLQKQVFKSIVGYYWYLRLRGYEIDSAESKRSSIGHQYALPHKTTDVTELKRLLLKLCEKTGRRLRKSGLYGQGIHLYFGFVSQEFSKFQFSISNKFSDDRFSRELPSSFENMHKLRSWKQGMKVDHRLYSTEDIYRAACYLLERAAIYDKVKLMSVTVFDLHDWDPEQLGLFDAENDAKQSLLNDKQAIVQSDFRAMSAKRRMSDAIDIINNRYGEYVVTPATMMDMRGEILDRIAFGQVRDM